MLLSRSSIFPSVHWFIFLALWGCSLTIWIRSSRARHYRSSNWTYRRRPRLLAWIATHVPWGQDLPPYIWLPTVCLRVMVYVCVHLGGEVQKIMVFPPIWGELNPNEVCIVQFIKSCRLSCILLYCGQWSSPVHVAFLRPLQLTLWPWSLHRSCVRSICLESLNSRFLMKSPGDIPE